MGIGEAMTLALFLKLIIHFAIARREASVFWEHNELGKWWPLIEG